MRQTKHMIWSCFMLCTAACGCSTSEQEEASTIHIHIPATASTQELENVKLPAISFQDSVVDFGILAEGSQVEHTFTFQNTGEAPLLITDVSTSCGCTLAESWSRNPIEKGEMGSISVRFDSRDRIGKNEKKVQVVTNAYPSTETLLIIAEVIGPE
ncbi:MAG: DUF1573 domain-containing protein [Flavobacteriales bacterium]